MQKISVLLCMLSLLLADVVMAAEAHFSWLPNTEENLAGYKIYCGAASRTYGAPVDVAGGTIVAGKVIGAVPGLTAGQTYFCAATAYDRNGFESDWSNEVEFVADDRTYPAMLELQLIILRHNPDGTYDLLKADGAPLLDAAGKPIVSVTLP